VLEPRGEHTTPAAVLWLAFDLVCPRSNRSKMAFGPWREDVTKGMTSGVSQENLSDGCGNLMAYSGNVSLNSGEGRRAHTGCAPSSCTTSECGKEEKSQLRTFHCGRR
jgi:hypothetical protein